MKHISNSNQLRPFK